VPGLIGNFGQVEINKLPGNLFGRASTPNILHGKMFFRLERAEATGKDLRDELQRIAQKVHFAAPHCRATKSTFCRAN
jgi:hypothetical protein